MQATISTINPPENCALINRWSATQVYTSKGFVYPFLYSVKSASDAPPDGYDEKRAQSILSAYEDADIPEEQRYRSSPSCWNPTTTLPNTAYQSWIPRCTRTTTPWRLKVSRETSSPISLPGHRGLRALLLTGLLLPGFFRSLSNLYLAVSRPGVHGHRGPSLLCLVLQQGKASAGTRLWGLQVCGKLFFADDRVGTCGYDDLFFPGAHPAMEANKALGKTAVSPWTSPCQARPMAATTHSGGRTADDYVPGGDYTDAGKYPEQLPGSIYNTNQI
ncbi:MAG: hypothetical protein ACLSAF_04890 [Intestinimonas sp.]